MSSSAQNKGISSIVSTQALEGVCLQDERAAIAAKFLNLRVKFAIA
jgi:hypothetical protein